MNNYRLSANVNGSRVDRTAGTLSGCIVLSLGEAKGHGVMIDANTLTSFMALNPVKKKAFMTHGSFLDADRLGKALGYFHNFTSDNSAIRADFTFYKSTVKNQLSDVEKIYDMAEDTPDELGLSIAFAGDVVPAMKDGKVDTSTMPSVVVEELFSIDFVSEPAATSSLFEEKANQSLLVSIREAIFGKKKKKHPEDDDDDDDDDVDTDVDDFSEIKESIKGHAEKIGSLETRCDGLEAKVASLNNELASKIAEVMKLNAVVETTKVELAEKKEEAKTAQERADKLKSLFNDVEVPIGNMNNTQLSTDRQIAITYGKLKGDDKKEFYIKYREQILRALAKDVSL